MAPVHNQEIEVSHEELAKFAKSSCKSCGGEGVIVRQFFGPASRDPVLRKYGATIQRVQDVCRCALKRWQKNEMKKLIAMQEVN